MYISIPVQYNLVKSVRMGVPRLSGPRHHTINLGIWFESNSKSFPDPSPSLIRISSLWPMQNAQCLYATFLQVKTPVLLTLGEDDKRVPPKQGIEYYRALKARNIPVRWVKCYTYAKTRL